MAIATRTMGLINLIFGNPTHGLGLRFPEMRTVFLDQIRGYSLNLRHIVVLN
jgi:hypothetical protein